MNFHFLEMLAPRKSFAGYIRDLVSGIATLSLPLEVVKHANRSGNSFFVVFVRHTEGEYKPATILGPDEVRKAALEAKEVLCVPGWLIRQNQARNQNNPLTASRKGPAWQEVDRLAINGGRRSHVFPLELSMHGASDWQFLHFIMQNCFRKENKNPVASSGLPLHHVRTERAFLERIAEEVGNNVAGQNKTIRSIVIGGYIASADTTPDLLARVLGHVAYEHGTQARVTVLDNQSKEIAQELVVKAERLRAEARKVEAKHGDPEIPLLMLASARAVEQRAETLQPFRPMQIQGVGEPLTHLKKNRIRRGTGSEGNKTARLSIRLANFDTLQPVPPGGPAGNNRMATVLYHLVLCRGTLGHHLFQKYPIKLEAYLDKLVSICAPGGKVVITDSHPLFADEVTRQRIEKWAAEHQEFNPRLAVFGNEPDWPLGEYSYTHALVLERPALK